MTPASTWNTRLSPSPSIVTPAAGPVIVSAPLVLLSSSGQPVRVMVSAVSNTVLSKSIVLAPGFEFARSISQRSEPAPLSAVLVTVNVDISLRSSRAITAGRVRRLSSRRPQSFHFPPLRSFLAPFQLMAPSFSW